jgi:hypothetical protein
MPRWRSGDISTFRRRLTIARAGLVGAVALLVVAPVFAVALKLAFGVLPGDVVVVAIAGTVSWRVLLHHVFLVADRATEASEAMVQPE